MSLATRPLKRRREDEGEAASNSLGAIGSGPLSEDTDADAMEIEMMLEGDCRLQRWTLSNPLLMESSETQDVDTEDPIPTKRRRLHFHSPASVVEHPRTHDLSVQEVDGTGDINEMGSAYQASQNGTY